MENPIATSITTHPIDDLDFPVVSICPPKDSSTALYHDLVKAGNKTLSDKDRDALKEAAYAIFMEESHKDYVKAMLATSSPENMIQLYQGYHSLPKPYNHGSGLEIKMWNLNGTFTAPWNEQDYLVEEYCKEERNFHLVLELPRNIRDQVGSGALHIDLNTYNKEDREWIEKVSMYTFHRQFTNNWTEAEAECKREGGHLASVASEEMNAEVLTMMSDDNNPIWLGGKNVSGKWAWSDNSTWGYTNFEGGDGSCVVFSSGTWIYAPCSMKLPFICQRNKALIAEKGMNLVLGKDQLNFSRFHIWYNERATSQQSPLNFENSQMTGFKVSWNVKKPTVIWTSSISEVGRPLQTPQLGKILVKPSDASVDHIYKVDLTVTDDFQAEIGDRTLVIELDVDMRKEDELAFAGYKLNQRRKSWIDAEAHCKSEGGQLASIHSELQQELAEKAAEGNFVLLGGKREAGNAKWSWSDNSTRGGW